MEIITSTAQWDAYQNSPEGKADLKKVRPPWRGPKIDVRNTQSIPISPNTTSSIRSR